MGGTKERLRLNLGPNEHECAGGGNLVGLTISTVPLRKKKPFEGFPNHLQKASLKITGCYFKTLSGTLN